MQIFLKTLTGKTIPIQVELWDTVSDLKARIQNMEGIPQDDQRLIYNGQQLQDESKLSDYNIVSECSIHFIIKLRAGNSKIIFVKTIVGKTIQFDFDQYDTIENFKLKIQESEGYSPEQQKLIYAGRELEVGKTFHDYNIPNESTLHLLVDEPKKLEVEEEDDVGGLFD